MVGFERALRYYENMLSQLPSYSSQNSFSEEHIHNILVARMVIDRVNPKCTTFLNIVRGKTRHHDLKPLCFTERFLGISSTDGLLRESQLIIDSIIDDVFYLGLTYHLVFMKYPTRHKVERVDLDKLYHEWLPRTLVADTEMKAYNKDENNTPIMFFNVYHKDNIDPALKQLKVGLFKRGLCRSNFKNLFFAGVLLGLMFDLATQL